METGVNSRRKSSTPATAAPRGSTVVSLAFFLGFFITEIHPGQHIDDISLQTHLFIWPFFLVAFLLAALAHTKGTGKTLSAGLIVLALGLPGLFFYGENASNVGSDAQYLRSLMFTVFAVGISSVLAFQYYSDKVFTQTWWKVGRFMLAAAILGYFAAESMGWPWMATYADYGGGWRLTGFLSEPSAWAPVIASLAIMAVQRKAWLSLALVVFGFALTRSPTVALTLIIAAAAVIALSRTHVLLKISGLISLVAAISLSSIFKVNPATVTSLLASDSPLEIMAGRLLSGVQFLSTGGSAGDNTRAEGSQYVWQVVQENSWDLLGRGIGAGEVYLPATSEYRAWSLWSTMLFDVGLMGSVIFFGILAMALWRGRRAASFPIFISFTAAAMINSAQGNSLYGFTYLAIMVYLFKKDSPGNFSAPQSPKTYIAQGNKLLA